MKGGDQRQEQVSGAGSWSGTRARCFMVAARHPAAATACEQPDLMYSLKYSYSQAGVGGGGRGRGHARVGSDQPSVRRSPWRKGKKNVHVLLLSRNRRGATVQRGFLLKTDGENVFIVFTL